jgi:hypothetical protein
VTDPLTLAINLSATTRRWLATAILSIFLLLAAAFVVAIMGFLDARRGEIDELRRELGRVKWLVDRGRDLQQEADERGRSIDALFLAGEDEAGAASTLQTIVTEAARESGLDVISSGRAPAFTAEGVTMIGVRIDVSGEASAVYDFLDGLFHRLPNAEMRKVAIWRSASGDAIRENAVLVAQIEVFGALQPRGASAGAAR